MTGGRITSSSHKSSRSRETVRSRRKGLQKDIEKGMSESFKQLSLFEQEHQIGQKDPKHTTSTLDCRILTLWQPWASAITYGLKRFVTRSWGTSYRGTLLIHAAKRKPTLIDIDYVRPHLGQYSIDQLTQHFGCIVAIADLSNCQLMTPQFIKGMHEQEIGWGLWDPSRFAWELVNVKPLPSPIPCRGQQGLKPPPPHVADIVANLIKT